MGESDEIAGFPIGGLATIFLILLFFILPIIAINQFCGSVFKGEGERTPVEEQARKAEAQARRAESDRKWEKQWAAMNYCKQAVRRKVDPWEPLFEGSSHPVFVSTGVSLSWTFTVLNGNIRRTAHCYVGDNGDRRMSITDTAE
jgi:Na+-transporting methylmalonyl-CoA/oxaloacetate decarboxylase gamma subunit